jgi:hypothetical protein
MRARVVWIAAALLATACYVGGGGVLTPPEAGADSSSGDAGDAGYAVDSAADAASDVADANDGGGDADY